MIIAALLCLMMLLVACDDEGDHSGGDGGYGDGGSGDGGSGDGNGKDERPSKSDEQVNYADLLAAWDEYIDYNKKEYEKPESTLLFSKSTDDEKYIQRNGTFLLTTHSRYNVVDNSYGKHDAVYYHLYNIATGEEVRSGWTERNRIEGPDYQGEPDNPSSYSFNFYGNIVCVRAYEWEVVDTAEPVNPGEPAEPIYGYATEYRYYDENGEELAVTDTQEAYTERYNGLVYTYLKDKVYVTTADTCKTLYTFKRGEEPVVVNTDAEYMGEYKNFCYGTYINRDQTQGIFVYDKEGGSLVTYIPEDRDVMPVILSNGDVLFVYILPTAPNATDYSFEAFDGGRFVQKAVILNAKTGAITEPELDYAVNVETMITNASQDNTPIKIKDGYALAEISKIGEDKKLSAETDFVILDSSMAVVKELPKLFKNQTGFAGLVSENKWIFKTNAGDETVYYAVDKDGSTVTVSQYFNMDDAEYTFQGGFVYNNIVYGANLNSLYDLKDGYVISVKDDSIRFRDSEDVERLLYYSSYGYFSTGTVLADENDYCEEFGIDGVYLVEMYDDDDNSFDGYKLMTNKGDNIISSHQRPQLMYQIGDSYIIKVVSESGTEQYYYVNK